MELSENFTVERNRKCRSMISTIRLVENNNLEACDSILQIGHYLGRNRTLPLEVQTVVLMIRTKRLREHDDSEA